MLSTHNLKKFVKKAFMPVTIMFIPHNSKKPLSIKMPSLGIIVCVALWLVGTIFVFSKTVQTIEYRVMKQRLNYYSQQFSELHGTILGLKNSETEFKKLFSLKSKKDILENIDTSSAGSPDLIDFENLRKQIAKTIDAVAEIKDYLYRQRDIYQATPIGSPVKGSITSYYGRRIHPHTGREQFHLGIDIKTSAGSPVKVTANGIVSFSGWSGNNGNLIVVEHGMGFSTYYAHNKENLAKVGQRVRKGETIGYVGATGNAQTAHLHYSVLKSGSFVNPKNFLDEGMYVQKE
ncbi:MAG: M23 family metallopeptidase [Proteobacteria bacterium]|nr:M23 family metallopeptidase [Pseudomonadota bacterium]